MEDFLTRLTSRKFLLCIAGCVGFILLGASGAQSWPDALDDIKVLILAYIAAEGTADVVARLNDK